jgi:hypothetical protein
MTHPRPDRPDGMEVTGFGPQGMEVTGIRPQGMEVTRDAVGQGMEVTGLVPLQFDSDRPVPDTLIGYLSLRSPAKIVPSAGSDAFTIGQYAALIRDHPAEAIAPFKATAIDKANAFIEAQRVGLTILAISDLGIAVSGPTEAFERLTGATAVSVERLMRAEMGRRRYVSYVDLRGRDQPRALGVARAQRGSIEAVVLERPRLPYGEELFPSPTPPGVPKHHLTVPDGVAKYLRPQGAHARFTGNGVTVAMVDTGHYPHPFFSRYDVRPVVTMVPETDADVDPVGHGTGESANIFAVAPGVRLQPYRATDKRGNLVGALAGFMSAKAEKPKIMTNSWGGDGPFPPTAGPDPADWVLALEIADALAQGIVVIFSAGNGQFSIEPQVPGVLAAGGVFADPEGHLIASNYASGYESPWFDGVIVPTVSGLVGMTPRAQYLMLPVPPGSEIDAAESQPTVDDAGDGTTPADGWALFSGTSAAAPQLAGAAALLIEAFPWITPAQVVEALSSTARDVVHGQSHARFNEPARTGQDLATGFGLINVSAAIDHAKASYPQPPDLPPVPARSRPGPRSRPPTVIPPAVPDPAPAEPADPPAGD